MVVRDYVGDLWQVHQMALDQSDINALQLLIREEIRSHLEPMEHRIDGRFDQVMTTLDTLVASDEKREQENAIRDEQLKRVDERVESLEKKVA